MKTFITFILAVALPGLAFAASEQRCGWFENPDPHEAWLSDKDSDWFVSIHNDEIIHEAEGKWPVFTFEQWVTTTRNSGYGCACITGLFDYKTHKVKKIIKSIGKPLSACRSDTYLTEPQY